jgi:hypothetical protein
VFSLELLEYACHVMPPRQNFPMLARLQDHS